MIKLKRKRWILLISGALLVFCAFIGTASAGFIYVPDDYATIQGAVNNANAGDTIIVRDGNYTGNVAVNKQLTIRSENGPALTTVNALNPAENVFSVSADRVQISGITVKNGKAGINLENVDHCIISNITASKNGYGIRLKSSSSNTLTGNTANSNIYYGIYLISSSSNTLTSNTANSNNFYGIWLFYLSNSNTLTSNTANSNNFYGIYLTGSSNSNTLTGNIANLNNGYGIRLTSSSDNRIYNNYFSNINNAYDDGSNIWNTTKTLETNIIDGPYLGGNYWSDYTGMDTNGDGLGDTSIPYNSSGNIFDGGDYLPLRYLLHVPDDYATIQGAVNNANAGDTIIVRDGNYTGNVAVNKQLTIRSENGPALTTVNALNPAENVFSVSADRVQISGFTVKNGKAGIYLGESVKNCRISENIASKNEDGIKLRFSSNNALTSNTVKSNKNKGISLDVSSNDNKLTGNNAKSNNGIGISLLDSSSNTLTNNAVSYNDNGISLDVSSNDNKLTGNTANSNNGIGISLLDSSSNTLTNNAVSYNDNGIVLAASSSNTLKGNTANLNINYGIRLTSSSDNRIYNNYFSNTNNAYDDGSNIWNTTKTLETNIIGGPYLGGNYWSDYTGMDTNGDGLGDTSIPYKSSGNIIDGGDYLPLIIKRSSPALTDTITDIINDVNILADEGVLNQGQRIALIKKLEHASTQVDQGNANIAGKLLQAFVNNVASFVGEGILTLDEGQSLIDPANEIINALSGT